MSNFDISDTLEPKSDQLDAVDLAASGPRTFTITGASRGKSDQPVNLKLAEFPRVWRPGKSMRRVLAICWGADASQWIGRRVRLYCDPTVQFGDKEVGGTRIAALSHIDGTKKIPLLVTRGKSMTYKVEPLADESPADALKAAKSRLWQIAQSHDEPMDWLTGQAAKHKLSLDSLADVQQLIEKVQS